MRMRKDGACQRNAPGATLKGQIQQLSIVQVRETRQRPEPEGPQISRPVRALKPCSLRILLNMSIRLPGSPVESVADQEGKRQGHHGNDGE